MTRDAVPALLRDGGPFLYAGVHDALGAHLALRSGFDGVWLSSLGLSLSLGVSDDGVLTMTELLQAADRVIRAGAVDLVLDCDTGFGGPSNVRRLVAEASRLGMSAICIEDHAEPKANSFSPGYRALAEVDGFCDKLRAARKVRRTERPVIVARTEALVQDAGVESTVSRCHAYCEAGAEALIVHTTDSSPKNLAEVMLTGRFDVPVGVIPTSLPSVSVAEFRRLGFGFVVYANQALRASVSAATSVLEAIVQTGFEPSEPEQIAMAELIALTSGVIEEGE